VLCLPARRPTTEVPVILTALSDAVLAEPALAETLVDPAHVGTLDLIAPAGLRPFLVDGLVRAGRTVLLVTATGREAEELTSELSSLMDPSGIA
jgi:transcription-repair coupling factor (superfamily II helicase)